MRIHTTTGVASCGAVLACRGIGRPEHGLQQYPGDGGGAGGAGEVPGAVHCQSASAQALRSGSGAKRLARHRALRAEDSGMARGDPN